MGEYPLEVGVGSSAGAGSPAVDGVSGSCLTYLLASCPALGAGSNWKVDVNALGGLSDPDSADEEEDEYLRARPFFRLGFEVENDADGDDDSVAG